MQTLQQKHPELSDQQLNLALAAAWHILENAGYQAITMAAISVRTGIKKQLLAQKWPKRSLLVRQAVINLTPSSPH